MAKNNVILKVFLTGVNTWKWGIKSCVALALCTADLCRAQKVLTEVFAAFSFLIFF